ncbi:MAG: CopG family antitoxin [Candidatus Hydrogenedentota bacterium]
MSKKYKLDKEEKEILQSVESGEWVSIPDVKGAIKRYANYARDTIKKDKRVNIRISNRDLEMIQRKAIEEGIPYQTLISSLIHKYISGRLVEGRI